MDASSKKDTEQAVIRAAREYGISTTLFRNAVGGKIGVNVTDMECLGLLFFKGIATPSELSEYTGLTSGATTAMLNRMEKAGLIIRKPNPNDRRGVLIEVNKSSVQSVGPMFAEVREGQSQLTASYTSEELSVIKDFLERYTALWEQSRKKLNKTIDRQQ